MASVEDEDGEEMDEMWTWARSSDMMEWTAIDEATSSSYTPQRADENMYLRATVSYIDAATSEDDASTEDVDESRDEASGVSEKTVEANPDANAVPEFAPDVDDDMNPVTPNIYEISEVKENTTGEIGEEPITATDTDNDVLLYSLSGTDVDEFDIHPRTGQISVAEGVTLDFEMPTGGVGSNNNTYEVTVTATDPSDAPGTATVHIEVVNVDEEPTGLPADPIELTIGEDGDDDNNPDDALAPSGSLSFTVTDPEGATPLVWTLSGPDAKAFGIDGTLRFNASTTEGYVAPDHETKPEYKITIEVAGTGSDVKAMQDVTVKVTDMPEGGTVTLSARQPQVGKSVTAELEEKDDNVSGIQWRWTTVSLTLTMCRCEHELRCYRRIHVVYAEGW